MMQITPRERWLSIGLAAGIAVWALYALAIKPAQERIRTLQRVIPEKQSQLRDLRAQTVRYIALRDELAQLRATLAAQEPDFQLPSFLETEIERHQLARHIVTMEPDLLQPRPDYCEQVVTIELHDVSLRQLIDFLSAVETAKSLVRVGSLHIRRNPRDEALLDSTIGIYSPRFNGPALATQTAP